MLLGSIFFKFVPIRIWGSDILFDASFHLMTAFFILYVLYFFVDQDRGWRTPFFILSGLVLFIVAVQRIIANAHNDVGLLLGLIIALVSIGIAERKGLKGKFKF